MDTIDDRLAVTQPLNKFWYKNKVAAMDMLRLDLLHPVVSGNKWYKLRLNLKYATENGFRSILTFGGGFSNHLVATAYAAKIYGIACIGVVRGKYDQLTPTLAQCKAYGMEIIFVTKEDYNNKNEPGWAKKLAPRFDEVFIIPEGGANHWGREGAGLIKRFIKDHYTHIILSVGSGTTLAGLRNKLIDEQQVLGFVPMKGGVYVGEQITGDILPLKNRNWQLFDEWHFGGFGKWNSDLIDFMNSFYSEHKIPLDIVYTSKMMYGVNELLNRSFFNSADKLLCIHSGGLQGNVSINGQLIFENNC